MMQAGLISLRTVSKCGIYASLHNCGEDVNIQVLTFEFELTELMYSKKLKRRLLTFSI